MWIPAVLGLAGLKAAVAIAVFLATRNTEPGGTLSNALSWITVVEVVTCSALAVFLIMAGRRRDRRAVCLGGVFLLLASSSADRMLAGLAVHRPVLTTWLTTLQHLNPDAFLPVFVWSFFREFPSALPFGAGRRIPEIAIRGSVITGAVLFAAYGLSALPFVAPSYGGLLRRPELI
jgi:hypothetical protein